MTGCMRRAAAQHLRVSGFLCKSELSLEGPSRPTFAWRAEAYSLTVLAANTRGACCGRKAVFALLLACVCVHRSAHVAALTERGCALRAQILLSAAVDGEMAVSDEGEVQGLTGKEARPSSSYDTAVGTLTEL